MDIVRMPLQISKDGWTLTGLVANGGPLCSVEFSREDTELCVGVDTAKGIFLGSTPFAFDEKELAGVMFWLRNTQRALLIGVCWKCGNQHPNDGECYLTPAQKERCDAIVDQLVKAAHTLKPGEKLEVDIPTGDVAFKRDPDLKS